MAKGTKLGQRICPKCKETIKVDASLCKHCGTEFTPEEISLAKADAKKGAKYGGIGCLLLVLALGTCTYIAGKGEPAPEVPDRPTASAKADAIAFYRGIMQVIGPCDRAGAGVAEASKAGDLVNLFSAANEMETACLKTPSGIREVKVPVSVGKASFDKLTKTREVCENAYVQKWSAAKKMKAALDSDGKISALAELKEAASLVQTGTIVCATGLVGEIMALGAKSEDLDAD
ncbi:zinc ribbon domain-containing protein [Novosphingobium lindaniclasticum]|uniref:zinc ribbon domain-containing protein n=1 Tax=Novosphingobium lindaniclasticum TaxID=1329895 RepID=UPI0013628FC5|nr:zinc ribbon domain-containing protein [Novosphingobium lindaniclasticum]